MMMAIARASWGRAFRPAAGLLPITLLLTTALLAATAQAGTARFARLGSFEGPVEVQWDAADAWRPAAVNLPLPESTRIRTGVGAKVEIEFDDSNVFRMAGEGLAELSDYTRLSGGQRITVISLDHGLAYFTGDPGEGNWVHLLVPGAQAGVRQGSRIRLQAFDDSSEIAVIEGGVRFIVPTAEMDLHQGQSARVTVPASTHFSLFREIAPLELDGWSEQLDKAEANAPASRLDLNAAGKWINDGDYGTIWQPAPQAGWAPFRDGRWIWYQSVGFVWAAAEPWGWKPYHEGRWLQHRNLGWVWIPSPTDGDFSPGAVFWARNASLAAWGPLAPGEQWNGTGPPRQFAAANVTGGAFVSGTREILPSPLDEMPKDLLKAFLFTAALPSPALPVTRLTASRDPLRSRLFSAVEVTPDVRPITRALPPPEDAPAVAEVAPLPVDPVIAPDPVVSDSPPAPIVPGIIAIKSRDRKTPRPTAPSSPAKAYVAQPPVSYVPLNGAGPSAPAPLYQHWFQRFGESSKEALINYQAGSGFRELKKGQIDFAATDMPLTDAQISELNMHPLHFPSAVSAVVAVYNVPGIYDGLKLTPEVLAGICLGVIRYWNDPRIVAVNPRASLPPTSIILVTRSDASSTTFIFTDYLSKISPTWKSKVGAAATVNWPVAGLVGKGDDGVERMVQQTAYSLGYVDYAWAMSNNILFASVKNHAGNFTLAQQETLTAAAASAVDNMASDLRTSITDATGTHSYPIASFTYLLAPQKIDDSHKRAALSDFLRWMVTEGQKDVPGYHFAPLPPEIVAREKNQLSLIK